MLKRWCALVAIGLTSVIATASPGTGAERPQFPGILSGGVLSLKFGISVDSHSPDSYSVITYCTIGGQAPTTTAPVTVGTVGPGTPSTYKVLNGVANFSYSSAAVTAATSSSYSCATTITDTANPSHVIKGNAGGTWSTAGTSSDHLSFIIPAPAAAPSPSAVPSPTPTLVATPKPSSSPAGAKTPIPNIVYSVTLQGKFVNVEVGSTYSVRCVTFPYGTSYQPFINTTPVVTSKSSSFSAGIPLSITIPGDLAATSPSTQCTLTVSPYNSQKYTGSSVNGDPATFQLPAATGPTNVNVNQVMTVSESAI